MDEYAMDIEGVEVDVSVRAAEEEDIEVMVEMTMSTVAKEKMLGMKGYEVDEVKLGVEISKRLLRCWADPRYLFLVGVVDEEVVGMLSGAIEERDPIFDPHVVLRFEMLHVKEGVRRKGVGLAMLTMFEALAYREGVRKLEAMCYQGNVEPQWGLLKTGYQYESIVMTKYFEQEG